MFDIFFRFYYVFMPIEIDIEIILFNIKKQSIPKKIPLWYI